MKRKILKLECLGLICVFLAFAICINQYSMAEDPEPECTLSVSAEIELVAGQFWWEASFTTGCSALSEWAIALVEWEGLDDTVYGPYYLEPPSLYNPVSDNFAKKANVDRAMVWAGAKDNEDHEEEADDTDPDWP